MTCYYYKGNSSDCLLKSWNLPLIGELQSLSKTPCLIIPSLLGLSLFQKSEEPKFLHPTSLPQQLPSQQLMSKDQDEQEELDFLFDEEMEQMDGRKNTFTAWSDEDSDYEIDDRDVNKILIVTQTPPYMRRHPGGTAQATTPLVPR